MERHPEGTESPAALAAAFADELARADFPPAGTAVICAVSGGPDSTALLILAVAAGCEVTAVHVDHGLRDDSAADADVVAALAQRFGAAFRAETVTVDPGPNLEARAREARHAVLPDDALLGHTADDQAETVLLNLMRGAGVDGLAGMREDGRRPLLHLRRADTMAVCTRAGVAPITDEMNMDPLFRRVRVRHELIPLLNQIADRDVVPILARQAGLMADESSALEILGLQIDVHDARAVAAAPEAIARRAVRRLLRDGPALTHPPDRATVERVLDVAAGKATGTDVGAGWQVRRTDQRLRLVPPDDAHSPESGTTADAGEPPDPAPDRSSGHPEEE